MKQWLVRKPDASPCTPCSPRFMMTTSPTPMPTSPGVHRTCLPVSHVHTAIPAVWCRNPAAGQRFPESSPTGPHGEMHPQRLPLPPAQHSLVDPACPVLVSASVCATGFFCCQKCSINSGHGTQCEKLLASSPEAEDITSGQSDDAAEATAAYAEISTHTECKAGLRSRPDSIAGRN